MKKIRNLLFCAAASSILYSCSKNDDVQQPSGPKTTVGVYVLNEGGYGKGNSAISYYNVQTGVPVKDYFKTVNNDSVGESANDLQKYGGKMYCTVTGIEDNAKSFVLVLDAATCRLLKRIPFFSGSGTITAKMPRYIVPYNGKVYISNYDGYISKIDTSSMTIESELNTSEPGLEGMAIANNKLYVANSSNYLHVSTNPSSVSVIDLATFKKLYEITTNYNPAKIIADSTGNLHVLTYGDYASINPAITIIDSKTDKAIKTTSFNAGDNMAAFSIYGNAGYIIGGPYGTPYIKKYDPSTGMNGANFITDGTMIASPYGLTINPLNRDVYITNSDFSGDGAMYAFSPDGKLKFKFNVSTGPKLAVFINQ